MAVDNRAFYDARVHVGDADQHADAAIGQLLGPLDLIQILGGVVVERGPEQLAQVMRGRSGRQLGVGLDRAQLGFGSGGEIRLKTVLHHGGMGRNDKIEVERMAGMHKESSSFKPKNQPTTPDDRHRNRDETGRSEQAVRGLNGV